MQHMYVRVSNYTNMITKSTFHLFLIFFYFFQHYITETSSLGFNILLGHACILDARLDAVSIYIRELYIFSSHF